MIKYDKNCLCCSIPCLKCAGNRETRVAREFSQPCEHCSRAYCVYASCFSVVVSVNERLKFFYSGSWIVKNVSVTRRWLNPIARRSANGSVSGFTAWWASICRRSSLFAVTVERMCGVYLWWHGLKIYIMLEATPIVVRSSKMKDTWVKSGLGSLRFFHLALKYLECYWPWRRVSTVSFIKFYWKVC